MKPIHGTACFIGAASMLNELFSCNSQPEEPRAGDPDGAVPLHMDVQTRQLRKENTAHITPPLLPHTH